MFNLPFGNCAGMINCPNTSAVFPSCEQMYFQSQFIIHSVFRDVLQYSLDQDFLSYTTNNATLQHCKLKNLTWYFVFDICLFTLASSFLCIRSSSHLRLKIDLSLIEIRGNVVLEPQKDYCFFI